MDRQILRKTFKYKLKPTAEQERELERVLRACRRLYNTALEQRKMAYERCGVSLSRYAQEAELKGLRAAMPEYAAMHSHVLQDVLARLDKAFQAFFRRIREGQTPGFPRFHGRDRYNSFTYKEFDKAHASTTASCSSPKSAGWRCAGRARWRGRPRRSRCREKPMAGMSASPVPMCRCNPCQLPGKRRA